ncbi:hypothetical protein FA95DRAFT_1555456 [Auriscalpium vulgare]|uniref:Uncharacterized protein n=1 Tax=Auriscalpium vulgare TaxID=40419 RepID=A0ACB8S3W1_9AGAM|nr:hypothetical protein FA95DRAFT_1555456 [Auriscalpium vulgare]
MTSTMQVDTRRPSSDLASLRSYAPVNHGFGMLPRCNNIDSESSDDHPTFYADESTAHDHDEHDSETVESDTDEDVTDSAAVATASHLQETLPDEFRHLYELVPRECARLSAEFSGRQKELLKLLNCMQAVVDATPDRASHRSKTLVPRRHTKTSRRPQLDYIPEMSSDGIRW